MSDDLGKPPETEAELRERLRRLVDRWHDQKNGNERIYGQNNPVAMTFYWCADDLNRAVLGSDHDKWDADPPAPSGTFCDVVRIL